MAFNLLKQIFGGAKVDNAVSQAKAQYKPVVVNAVHYGVSSLTQAIIAELPPEVIALWPGYSDKISALGASTQDAIVARINIDAWKI